MVSTANGWVLRATGSASDMVADQGEVRRALALGMLGLFLYLTLASLVGAWLHRRAK